MAITAGPAVPTALREPEGPRGHPFVGNLYEYARDPLAFLQKARREYGEVARLRFARSTSFLVSNPAYVKHILQDNHRNYERNEFSNTLLKLFLGDSVLTLDGGDWLRQRRLMAPAFHRQRIAGFGETMVDAASAMLDRWAPRAARGEVLDLAEEMMGLTFEIAGRTLFSVDLSDSASEMGVAISEAQHFFNYRTRTLLAPPLWLPTRMNRAFHHSNAVSDRLVYGMIRERRADGADRGDLLSMLMAARDEETGEAMDDTELRNELLTMLNAGHETTSNALSWTFYLLALNPEAERKLQAELSEVLDGRLPGVEDLPKLPYNRMVLEESMRLFPPAWILGRQAIAGDELGPYRIPAGAGLLMSPFVIHRDPELWEAPLHFRPERFRPEAAASRPKYAYFPFGGGPHLCIGNLFALTEAQLLLATIAQRFTLRLVPGHPVEPEPLITLRPRHGLRMTLAPR